MFDLKTRPHDHAIVDAGGSITRSELASAIASGAGHLRSLGVAEKDVVLISVDLSIRSVIALLAARATGALACSVNPNQIEAAATKLDPKVIIGAEPVKGHGFVGLDALGNEGEKWTQAAIDGAWGIHTSGSTGAPKTVVLSAATERHLTTSTISTIGYRADDEVYMTLPFSHILGLSQIWICLRAGCTLHLPPPSLPPMHLAKWAGEATMIPAIPVHMRMLSHARRKPPLRMVTLGGQVTMPEDRVLFTQAYPKTEFYNIYGSTEAFRTLWLHPDEFVSRPEATGRPFDGVETWLDEHGELWVRGGNVADEYLGQEKSTSAKFPEPHTARTGDLFELSGDLYTYRGRGDSVFKSFGEKVLPEVVERALQTHAGVDKSVVTSEYDTKTHELRPVALIVANENGIDPDDVTAFLRERVPQHMVPARISVVESLPTTRSGKVLRHKLDA